MPPTQQHPNPQTTTDPKSINSVESLQVADTAANTGNTTNTHILRRHRLAKKPLFIALGIILILCISGGATVYVLSHVTRQITDSKTPQQVAADLAKQANNAATASANAGKTDDALAQYKEALAQYQKAGDEAGVSGVKLQIQYYEMVKANEEKAKANPAPAPKMP